MKNLIDWVKDLLSLILFLFLGVHMASAQQKDSYFLYCGSYTSNDSQGIDIYNFDSLNGKLVYQQTYKGIKSPSYLTLSPDRKYLYAVSELVADGDKSAGIVNSFSITTDGNLHYLNQVPTNGDAPCYVFVANDGKTVLVNNYIGGVVASIPVLEDGSLGNAVSVIKHKGSGPNKDRQEASHMHSIQSLPTGGFAYAADLGNDRVYNYVLDNKNGKLEHRETADLRTEPGAGPRHFEFNTQKGLIYVINELKSTVEVFDISTPTPKKIQVLSTLPDDFDGENFCADIHLHSSGKFLYGSNRGHNSIVLFFVSPDDGTLIFKNTFSVHGDWPRNFVISPTGKFLLVANQRSKNISLFKIDKDIGNLTFLSSLKTDSSPVCLKFGRQIISNQK